MGVFRLVLRFYWLALLLCIEVFDSPKLAVAQEPLDETVRDGVQLLDAFLEKVDSMTADFNQQLWSADNQLVETANGTVSLKRPNRFLWSYSAPLEQVVLSDGQSLWMYDIELAQVTVAPLDDVIAATPAMLLSGDVAAREGFEVLDHFQADGVTWVRLGAVTEGADFNLMMIGFRGGVLERLELIDGLNQITRIEFSNIELNPKMENDVFQFTAPDDVDIIGSTG